MNRRGKRKICAVTATRAEYGQLSLLLKMLQEDKAFDLNLVVTGTHLSPARGMTADEIAEDGIRIYAGIPIGADNTTTPQGTATIMAECLTKFTELLATTRPDIFLVLGDRFEIFAAAQAAMLNNIPIAHIGGGAVTAGAIDDSMRHCLSKMSQIHFTGAETERNRVLQLGESPEMVFNFGELTVDIIKETPLMSRKELEKSLNIKFKRRNILITFHPETLSPDDSPEHFRILLNELDKTRDTLLIFTAPNNDPGGDVIMAEIKKYNRMNPLKTAFFESLGKVRYLSALKIVDAVVGNSSSGLAEAPSFKTPAINVGNRQDGRLKASSVIDCEPDPARLSEALRKLYSAEFRKTLPFTVNPYGEGGASVKIKNVLKNICLDNIIMKKFNDIPCPQGFQ